MKKLKFKKWVLHLLYIIFIFIFINLLYKYNLISIYNNEVDITKLVVILAIYETIRKLTKNILKEYNEKIKF